MKSRRSFLKAVVPAIAGFPAIVKGATTYTSTGYSYFQGTVPVTAAPFTMACWFNVTDITAGHCLMSLGDFNTNNYHYMAANGDVASDPLKCTTKAGGADNTATTAGSYSASTWQHACAVFASATSRTIYLNGGNSGTNTGSASPTGIDYIAIGRIRVSNNWFNTWTGGSFAECAIWNAALNTDEVAALAKGFSPSKIRPQNLVFYVPGIREIIDVRGGLALTHSGNSVAAHPRRIG